MQQSRLGLLLALTICAMTVALAPVEAPRQTPPCPDFNRHWPAGRLVQEFHWGKGGRLACASPWTRASGAR